MTDQAAGQTPPTTTAAPEPNTTRPDTVPGGQVDDPNILRTDDFGLGGNLTDQLVKALEDRWNPDDPGATTLDDPDPSADTAATPAPAPDTSTDDALTQGQPVQDGAGGGRAADDGGAATPTDAATPPAPDTFDLNAYARDYFGTDLDRETSQRLFSMLSRLQSLTPQEQAMLDEYLSRGQQGQYPATLGQPAQQPTMAPTTAPTQDDPAVSVLGPRPDDEYLAQQWDLSARAYRATAEQMAAVQQNIAETTRAQQEQQYQQNVARIDRATSTWRESYKVLSDGEFDGLLQRAGQSQQLPALIQHHHGDVEAAVTALLEQQFWADPSLRERAIANLASGRTAGDSSQLDPNSAVAQDQQAADQGRQQLAASVAGGGGSVTPQTTAVPSDPAQKQKALVQEIAAQHDFT